jgi:DNA-binding winged helix-turn-helix (wHTH) protein
MNLQTNPIYEFGPFPLDAAEQLLLHAGETVQFTPNAFDLLLALLERHGRLLEKDELLKLVWPDTIVEETTWLPTSHYCARHWAKVKTGCATDQELI